MLKKIFTYELKYWIKSPSIYLYGLAFFAFAFLVFIGSAGMFDPPTDASENIRILNSPFEINYMLQYFNKFFLFLLPAVIGASIYKDYKYRIHSILYTFPIRKSDYLFGKFFSAFFIVVLLTLTVGIAFLIGEQLPGLDQHKIGSFNFMGYAQVYLLYVIPNMLFFGAIVFAVVTWTRNIFAGFVTVILLFFLQIIIENALGGTGQLYLLALLDPFAQNTTMYITQNWTLQEQNSQVIPVANILIFNRLFWLAFAALVFGAAYKKFTFNEHGATAFFKNKKGKRLTKENFSQVKKIRLVENNYDFLFAQRIKTIWKLSILELKSIVKSWLFLLLVGFGLFAIIFAVARVTNLEDMTILPVTRIMLVVPAMFFSMVIILLTFLYAGMLVHRPQASRMSQLIDTTPTPNWVLLLSKVLALINMQILLLLVMLLAGIIIQVFNGYYHFEIGLYLFHLFVILLPPLVVWSFVAVFFQTLIPNTYLGLFVLILGWLGIDGLSQVGIQSRLLLFNKPPDIFYTDQNGYAAQLAPYLLVQSYWLIFAGMVLLLAALFWRRGVYASFKERLTMARARLKGPIVYGFLGLAFCFIIFGFTIYSAEKQDKINAAFFKKGKQKFTEFQEKYKPYEGIAQPRITAVKLELDIFPETHSFIANGSYTLINKSSHAIDTVVVKTGFDEHTSFHFNVANEIISQDTLMRFSVFKLQRKLQPMDSLALNFTIRNRQNTLFEKNSNILENGTFIKQDFLPQIGYTFDDDNKSPSDTAARNKHYYAFNSDRVDFATTISTAEDQIAIAPGYLQKEWTAEGRRYFQYTMDQPIKMQFGFNSARFAVYQEKWKDVSLEVYHHKGHDHNLPQMIDGLKAALDYNTRYFGPYQHREARIIEFPHSEGSYATTMANSIPMSEIRFINNADTARHNIDLSFYVPAHELTHQWWGNQLVPADALGAVMLTESITEYITLQIYRQYYGEAQALDFLKQQRNRYLRGRTRERGEEPPLILVESEQQYLAYGKGAIAFNTLRHYLGEDSLNHVLRNFLENYKFKGTPYPVSIDLVGRLKQATPDSLQYMVEDFFETVTFYDAKIEDVSTKPLSDGTFELSLEFSVRKYRDGTAAETKFSLPLADYLEIGFFDQDGELMDLKNYKVEKEQNKWILNFEKKPASITIDPNCLLLDRNVEDNDWSL